MKLSNLRGIEERQNKHPGERKLESATNFGTIDQQDDTGNDHEGDSYSVMGQMHVYSVLLSLSISSSWSLGNIAHRNGQGIVPTGFNGDSYDSLVKNGSGGAVRERK